MPKIKKIAGYSVVLNDNDYGANVTVERENTREVKTAWTHYDDEQDALFAYKNIKSFSGVKNFVRNAESRYWNMKLSASN